MVEPELTLELLVVELHLPTHPCQPVSRSGSAPRAGWRSSSRSAARALLATRRSAIPRAEALRRLRAICVVVLAPMVCGVHARKDEFRGNRLAVGAVAEGDRLRAVCPESAYQLADRLRARGPGGRSGASRLGLLGRHGEAVPCATPSFRTPTARTHTQPDRVNRAARCSRRRLSPSTGAFGTSQPRRARSAPLRARGLVLNDLIRDLRLAPPPLILTPVLREPPPHRTMGRGSSRRSPLPRPPRTEAGVLGSRPGRRAWWSRRMAGGRTSSRRCRPRPTWSCRRRSRSRSLRARRIGVGGFGSPAACAAATCRPAASSWFCGSGGAEARPRSAISTPGPTAASRAGTRSCAATAQRRIGCGRRPLVRAPIPTRLAVPELEP